MKPTPEVPPVVSDGCITMTQSKWVTVWEHICKDPPTWPNTTPIGNGTAVNNGTAIQITIPTATDGISYSQEVVPDVWQTLQLTVKNVSSGTGYINVLEEQNGVLQSIGMQSFNNKGDITVNFKPQTSYITWQVQGPVQTEVTQLCFDRPVLKQENVLVTICPEDKDKYRFGFNGQEKVNEWAGIGNFMDYTWRGYDTRVARFLSRDPLTRKFPWYTPYQFAGNTPIQAIDLDGREELHYTTKTWRDGDGNTQVDLKVSTEVNALGHGSNGIWMTDINEIEGYHRDWYIPDAVVEDTRYTDPRSGVEQSAERFFTWAFNPVFKKVEKFDEYMSSASEVGLKIDFSMRNGTNSYNASAGVFSTSEDNFGFMASANYTKDIGFSVSSKTGLTSTGKGGSSSGFPISIKISAYASHSSSKIESGVKLTNKTSQYRSNGAGPFSIQHSESDGSTTDQISYGLDKKTNSKTDVSHGEGVRNVTELKVRSPMYNLK